MNNADQSTTPVVVSITGCAKEDADKVFRALGQSHASDRDDGDAPQYVSGDHATVWTATFDVSGTHTASGPVQLSEPVEAEIQGGYWAVDRIQETLASAFTVQEQGMAAGDQEKDVQLRLSSGGS
ncbi:hypothetical protein ACFWU3_28035 [Streptomyces sp. NPDC058685]|uniref:hypothetical protein n=1 Tax=Streptomyces sp. NPDC058685 TaxID=3346598 RepID=UPI00365773A7